MGAARRLGKPEFGAEQEQRENVNRRYLDLHGPARSVTGRAGRHQFHVTAVAPALPETALPFPHPPRRGFLQERHKRFQHHGCSSGLSCQGMGQAVDDQCGCRVEPTGGDVQVGADEIGAVWSCGEALRGFGVLGKQDHFDPFEGD